MSTMLLALRSSDKWIDVTRYTTLSHHYSHNNNTNEPFLLLFLPRLLLSVRLVSSLYLHPLLCCYFGGLFLLLRLMDVASPLALIIGPHIRLL